MDFAPAAASFIDPSALAIVLIGTLVATAARAGFGDMVLAIRSMSSLLQRGYDAHANRTALARWARALRQRGVLGADEDMPPDANLAASLKAMLRSGSLKAFEDLHQSARSQRITAQGRAAQVFEQAGDLAPVFGLVGTLFALTQIAPGVAEDASAATFGAIASAVLSSLYGVLSAHLVFLPLAGAIARRSNREEEARDALAAWLAEEIADVVPGGTNARRVTKLKAAV